MTAIAEALDVSPEHLLGRSALDQGGEVAAEADFDIQFDPDFEAEDVRVILTALADYYRACGGAGFEINLEPQEAPVKEPVHV